MRVTSAETQTDKWKGMLQPRRNEGSCGEVVAARKLDAGNIKLCEKFPTCCCCCPFGQVPFLLSLSRSLALFSTRLFPSVVHLLCQWQYYIYAVIYNGKRVRERERERERQTAFKLYRLTSFNLLIHSNGLSYRLSLLRVTPVESRHRLHGFSETPFQQFPYRCLDIQFWCQSFILYCTRW